VTRGDEGSVLATSGAAAPTPHGDQRIMTDVELPEGMPQWTVLGRVQFAKAVYEDLESNAVEHSFH